MERSTGAYTVRMRSCQSGIESCVSSSHILYPTGIKRHLSNKYRHGDVPYKTHIYYLLLQAPTDTPQPLGRREESKTFGDLS